MLQAKKDFGNPYILDMVVQHLGIDELASSFSAAVFDPHGYARDEFIDQLKEKQQRAAEENAERQQALQERRLGIAQMQANAKARTQVQARARTQAQAQIAADADAPPAKRKSKWDR